MTDMAAPPPIPWNLHAGLPHHGPESRAYFGPDYDYMRPVKVIRCWQVPNPIRRPGEPAVRVFTRLALQRIPDFWWPPDLEIKWFGILGSTPYLVLEQEPFDRDDESIIHYVARLLPSTTGHGHIVDDWVDEDGEVHYERLWGRFPPLVAPIKSVELERVSLLLEDVADRYRQPVLDALADRLGPIEVHGSAEYYAACTRERKISGSPIVADCFVGAGCSMPVLGVEHGGPGQLRVTLGRPFDDSLTPSSRFGFGAPKPETFEVRAYLQLDGGYLAISTCRSRLSTDPPNVYLVRLLDGAVAAPREQDGFDRVARALIDRLERGNRGGHFQPMEPWDDLAPIVRRLTPRTVPLPDPGHDPPTVVADPTPTITQPLDTSQSGQPTLSWRVCPACSGLAEAGYRYCGHCGAPLPASS